MSKLSEHFSSEELMCNCGCKSTYIEPRLVNALEELRAILNKPIKILSGYRCINHNSESGGGTNSQHLYGKGADITVAGVSLKALYEAALLVKSFEAGGIGIYPDNQFIHVDVRNSKARWARINKKVKNKVVQTYVSLEEGLKRVL